MEVVIDLCNSDSSSECPSSLVIKTTSAIIQQNIRQRQSARIKELTKQKSIAKNVDHKVASKKKKKKKGHGWSVKGTKKSRRQYKENTSRFYAVAKGFRTGIFDLRSNAMQQVAGYDGALYKSCKTLQEANDFIDEHRVCPPGIKTPFYPAPDTPVPPFKYVFPALHKELQQHQEQQSALPATQHSQTAVPKPVTTPQLQQQVKQEQQSAQPATQHCQTTSQHPLQHRNCNNKYIGERQLQRQMLTLCQQLLTWTQSLNQSFTNRFKNSRV